MFSSCGKCRVHRFVVVYGTNEEAYFQSHHIALHFIHGCTRITWYKVMFTVYDATSYHIGYGANGHDICIALALNVAYILISWWIYEVYILQGVEVCFLFQMR